MESKSELIIYGAEILMAGLGRIFSGTDAFISVMKPIISFVEIIKSRKDACFSARDTGSSVVKTMKARDESFDSRGPAVIDRRYSTTAGRRWRQGQP